MAKILLAVSMVASLVLGCSTSARNGAPPLPPGPRDQNSGIEINVDGTAETARFRFRPCRGESEIVILELRVRRHDDDGTISELCKQPSDGEGASEDVTEWAYGSPIPGLAHQICQPLSPAHRYSISVFGDGFGSTEFLVGPDGTIEILNGTTCGTD
jgi:hypothetical protein